MTADPTLFRYRGDGAVPAGSKPLSRGEPGAYLADPELITAVNTALAVEQPLLITGEPGTGKTALAWSVASELGLGPPLTFFTRSDHQARDALYVFDNLQRFYAAQVGDPQAQNPELFVRYQALGEAIRSPTPRVVLIDEIDKAPRDFPNDLLNELDQMEFAVRETGQRFTAHHRPIVIISSNSERQLPDPFLRRCVFHHIEFPSSEQLQQILRQRLVALRPEDNLVKIAVERFLELRELDSMEKRPATSELVTWVRLLLRAGLDPQLLENSPLSQLPYRGALIKTRHDLQALPRQIKKIAPRAD